MKYIAYYRVSTIKQGISGLGLNAQKDIVLKYINQNNGILINSYTEIESGKKNNRPQLLSALEECRKNNYILIVAKLDRLSRSVNFISALTDTNVDFVCCDFPSANKFTIHLFASVAQYERELISVRTKKALEEKKKEGQKLGNPHAYFSLDMIKKASKKRTEIANNNENNKRAFALITALRNTGKSFYEITSILNSEGFKTSKDCIFSIKQTMRIYNRYTQSVLS